VDGLTPALAFGYKERPKLVHRLDKDTSGVLLLARTDRVARGLSEALRHRAVRKIYWAAVAGVPTPRAGTIKFGLVKAGGPRGDEKMRAVHPREVDDTPGAKRAVTEFMTLENAGGRLSWVALQPVTGRTHQLRAHMAEIGHRSWATASTGAAPRRTWATAGARASAARSTAASTSTRACSVSSTP
jgi:23S rRNA pseudouridine955/2504/2580 synthase